MSVGSGTTTVDVPDWLPGGGPPPKRFQEIEYIDEGTQAMPAACGTYAGQPAEDLRIKTFYILDPVQGYLQTGYGDGYVVPGNGLVCAVDGYTLSYYDNTASGAVTATITNDYVDVLAAQTTGSDRRALAALRAGPSRRSAPLAWQSAVGANAFAVARARRGVLSPVHRRPLAGA